MLLMAEEGLPILFAPIPMSGATAPVTLAGAVALGNAEVFAGITLAQLLRPGTPCVYGAYGSSLDMRTSSNAYAGAEEVLIQAGMVQLARLHDLPTATNSVTTDSKAFDAQAGFEASFDFALTALAGANLSGTVGQLGVDQGACIEQLVMADEIAAITYRIIEGVRVDEETLALDVIDRVGPGGHFLGQKHTVANFNREHLVETVMDRSDWKYWKEHGAKDLTVRAREKAEAILSQHWPSPLPAETKSRLDELLAEASRATATRRSLSG
jgi:trimethylamine--corrinoid protein Co-methyltransferase